MQAQNGARYAGSRPEYLKRVYREGCTLLQTGQHERAADAFSAALAEAPDFGDAAQNLGCCLAALGRFKEAVTSYALVVQLRPDDAGSHFNLGSVLLEAGDIEDAITVLREAVRLDPGLAKHHAMLGQALVAANHKAEAQAVTWEAARQDGTNPSAGPSMEFGPHQLKRCRYGWMLFAGPYIGKCFELYGQYSEEEVRVIRIFVKPGDTAIDVGANIGDLTLPMAVIAGPTGRVYAVESHSDTFNILCTNLALNQIGNTKPINAFIADNDQVDTGGPWGKYGYVSQNWQPPFLSIDHLKLDSCAFIKIDVDGKELEVLRSAQATITACRPVIYLENDDRERSAALFEFLLLNEYSLYWHRAAIFEPENFYGNPVNHWAPQNIVSLMMLCIPDEHEANSQIKLKKVSHKDEWWS